MMEPKKLRQLSSQKKIHKVKLSTLILNVNHIQFFLFRNMEIVYMFSTSGVPDRFQNISLAKAITPVYQNLVYDHEVLIRK